MRPDVVGDLRYVRIIEGGVDFIQDEERRGLVTERGGLRHTKTVHRRTLRYTTCEWQTVAPRLLWSSHLQTAVPYRGSVSWAALHDI